jgi:predicted membrane-bound mannosyltransferase
MFYLAEAATTATAFDFMDIIMLLFTVLIAIGLVRLIKQPKRNYFGIAFTTLALAVFLFANVIMVFKSWLGLF